MSEYSLYELKHFCKTFRSQKNTLTRILHEEIRDLDFFTGVRCGISECCIHFYELSWLPSIKNLIPEYSETMWELSDETGILLCPDCISKKLLM